MAPPNLENAPTTFHDLKTHLGDEAKALDSPNPSDGRADLNVNAPQVRHVDFPYSEEMTLHHVSSFIPERLAKVVFGGVFHCQ